MSEKPQVAQDDERDLLEQIITQGLDRMKAPSRATAAEGSPADGPAPAPDREDSGEAAPPAVKKNRQSAVYLYLLILFGAAFLMLLLAYFIQQRSSETTISDLRDSMSLSREELLAEIKELEEQNAALTEQNTALEERNASLRDELAGLSSDLSQWERYGEETQETIDRWNQVYTDALADLYAWQSFWELERYYQAEDFESCAAVLLLMSQYGYPIPDGALERYDEIVPVLIDKCVLAGDYSTHISDYDELIEAFLAEHSFNFLSIGC